MTRVNALTSGEHFGWCSARRGFFIPSITVRSTPSSFPSPDDLEPRLFLAEGETHPGTEPGEAGVTSWSMAVLRQVADRVEFRERVQRVRELQRRLCEDESADAEVVEEIIEICHGLNNEMQVMRLQESLGEG
jgi:hypothetical protein